MHVLEAVFYKGLEQRTVLVGIVPLKDLDRTSCVD